MNGNEFKERVKSALEPVFDQWALERSMASTWTYAQGFALAGMALDGVLDVLVATLYQGEEPGAVTVTPEATEAVELPRVDMGVVSATIGKVDADVAAASASMG